MNSKRVMMLTLVLMTLVSAGQAVSGDTLVSLRGSTPIEDPSPLPNTGAVKNDRTLPARSYTQEPPLIPHPTKAYKINRKQNKCLDCHSPDNFEESKATRISQTHFQDRDGVDLDGVSGSRYFCNMCHVEQFSVPPLVENDFLPARVLQQGKIKKDL